MLPVDWLAALLLLVVTSTCVCAQPRYVAVWPTVALCTAVGAAYLTWRILRQQAIPLNVRLQLVAASAITMAGAIGSSAIYFNPHYRVWYRHYPRSLYAWLAALTTGVAWFAVIKAAGWWSERRRKHSEKRSEAGPSVED